MKKEKDNEQHSLEKYWHRTNENYDHTFHKLKNMVHHWEEPEHRSEVLEVRGEAAGQWERKPEFWNKRKLSRK